MYRKRKKETRDSQRARPEARVLPMRGARASIRKKDMLQAR